MSEVSSLPISHLPSSAEDVAPPIERFMTCQSQGRIMGDIDVLIIVLPLR